MKGFRRPEPTEYAIYHAQYINQVPEGDLLAILGEQPRALDALASAQGERWGSLRYGEDKWSVKELVGHVSDCERIYAYRLLRLGRGDATPCEGFDSDAYVAAARHDRRLLADLVAEFRDVRRASLTLLATLTEEDLDHRAVVYNYPVTARTMAFMIAGHAAHHLRILMERYLPWEG